MTGARKKVTFHQENAYPKHSISRKGPKKK